MTKDEAIEMLREALSNVWTYANDGGGDIAAIDEILAATANIEAPTSEAVAYVLQAKGSASRHVVWPDIAGNYSDKGYTKTPLYTQAAQPAADPAPVPAPDMLDKCRQFLEDMHAMPIEWTIRQSSVLHSEIVDWQARGQQAGVPEEVAGVDIKRLLRNLDDTSYNEGSEALACRLTDCHAVIKALLAAPGEAG